MKKLISFLAATVLVALTSCSSPSDENGGLTEINITEALNNPKDFKLSDLVRKVELLELEGSSDYYIEQAIVPHFGKKYILVMDYNNWNIYLFNRDGSFVRKIGEKGQGPGEHGPHIVCDMDPDENFIVVADIRVSKVIVYRVDGTVKAEKNISEYFANPLVQKISWDLPGLISFVPNRPYQPTENFASVVLFDADLNFAGQVLPRKNNDSLCYPNLSYIEAFHDGNRAWFWETYFDTLYQYDSDGKAEAGYYLTIEEKKLTQEVLRGSAFSKIYEYNQPMFVGWLGNYIVIHMLLGSPEGPSSIPVFYNLKTNEGFTIHHSRSCQAKRSDKNEAGGTLENDLFGFEPVALWFNNASERISVHPINIELDGKFNDVDCIKSLDVKYPEIRDRLVRAIEQPEEDDGTFLVLMHLN